LTSIILVPAPTPSSWKPPARQKPCFVAHRAVPKGPQSARNLCQVFAHLRDVIFDASRYPSSHENRRKSPGNALLNCQRPSENLAPSTVQIAPPISSRRFGRATATAVS